MKNNKKGRKKANRFPKLKKEIKDFLSSEEGSITEKKITKMGIILGSLAMMFSPDHADAQSHSSSLFSAGHTSHTSHASHASHGSHGSHGAGGWC